jgi:hypothetical protein
MNISSSDFTPGLTYVAVSRVRTLDGLMFEESFDMECFTRMTETATTRMRDSDQIRRRGLIRDLGDEYTQRPLVWEADADKPSRVDAPHRLL